MPPGSFRSGTTCHFFSGVSHSPGKTRQALGRDRKSISRPGRVSKNVMREKKDQRFLSVLVTFSLTIFSFYLSFTLPTPPNPAVPACYCGVLLVLCFCLSLSPSVPSPPPAHRIPAPAPGLQQGPTSSGRTAQATKPLLSSACACGGSGLTSHAPVLVILALPGL